MAEEKAIELTKQIALAKAKVDTLEEIKSISLWGRNLGDVHIIAQMKNLESVALSINMISTLEPFSRCQNLKDLFLRKNRIESLNELGYLRNLANLRILWLTDNPITLVDGYRQFCIALLPQITKLDEVDITSEERSAAKARFPNPESMIQPQIDEKQQCILKAIEDLFPILGNEALDQLRSTVLSKIHAK